MKVKLRGVRAIGITGEYIRLDALLKYASLAATGGEAKVMIQNGGVYIDGKPCFERGKKIRHGSIVRFGGDVLVINGSSNRAEITDYDD